MENINWDFDAPNFVDFGANEHLDDNPDKFFDLPEKSIQDSFVGNASTFNLQADTQQSPKELSKTPIGEHYFVQTPNRETYFVPTPSRVLRSSVKKVTFTDINNSTYKSNKSSINLKQNIQSTISAVSAIPKKKFKLTLPQSPDFASKKLIFKSRKSQNAVNTNIKSTYKSGHNSSEQTNTKASSKPLKRHSMSTRCKNQLSKPEVSMRKSSNPSALKRKVKSEASLTSTQKDNDIHPLKKIKLETTESMSKIKTASGNLKTSGLKKRSTIPEPFKLSSTRLSSRRPITLEEKNQNFFKAKPVPRSIYVKPKPFKNNKALDITVPVSPAFTSKHSLKHNFPLHDHLPASTKPSVVPRKSAVFKPKLTSSKTIPQPFSFDVKDKERLNQRSRIKTHTEKETKPLKIFKARPAPSTSSKLPPKEIRKSTKVEPFRLRCDQRANTRAKDSELMNKENSDLVRNIDLAANISRRSHLKVLNSKPWKPKLERKRPTKPLTPVFLSQARIKRREKLRNKTINYSKNPVGLDS